MLTALRPRLALQWRFALRPTPVVALYAGVLFFVLLGSARTFTYHESFTAQGAREMLATGDWIIPRVAGEPWLEKPPLPQWLAAVFGAPFGVNEFTARLPAAIAGLLGLLAITRLVERSRGPVAASLTGVFLATMTSIVTYARLAEPDIFLWAIVMGALACFAKAHVEPVAPGRWTRLAFFVLLGLTQTSKGPVFGAVMALAPCAAWLLVHRFRNVNWFLSAGWLLAAAIALAWPVAVLMQYPEALDLWRYHTLGRLDSTTAYNPKPFWYYLTTLPWQAAPALLFALPALPRSLKAAWTTPLSLDRWLWLWTISQLLTLSLASGKHHHYLIYALPPFAVWAAEGIRWYAKRLRSLWAWRIWRVGGTLLGVVLVIAGAVVVHQRGLLNLSEALAVGGFVLAGLFVTGLALHLRRDNWSAVAFAVTLAGVLLYVNTVWLSRTDIYKPDGELARRVEAITAPEETVYFYCIEPPRMLLDMDRRVVLVKTPEELQTRITGRDGVCIITALYYVNQIEPVTGLIEIDRTPQAKWPGRSISHLAAFRTVPRQTSSSHP